VAAAVLQFYRFLEQRFRAGFSGLFWVGLVCGENTATYFALVQHWLFYGYFKATSTRKLTIETKISYYIE